MFKIFVLVSLVAAVRAGILGAPYAAPAIAKVAAPIAVDTDYDPNPSYSYAYEIQDHLTQDVKAQHETRQGDVVQGSYSLLDPDGTLRTVEYTADPHNGFNAVVHKQPLAQQAKLAVAAPLALAAQPAPLALAAPAFTKLAPAPLALAAQPAPLALAAPAFTKLAPAPLALTAHSTPLALAAPALTKLAPAPLTLAAPALHTAPLSLHTKALL